MNRKKRGKILCLLLTFVFIWQCGFAALINPGSYTFADDKQRKNDIVTLDRSSWIVSASGCGLSSVVEYAIDGNPETKWTADLPQNPNQWFQIDLGRMAQFDKIVIDSGLTPVDYPKAYQVLASENGENWSQIAEGTGSSNLLEIGTSLTDTRYVKIVLTEQDNTAFWSIGEINLYNTQGAQPKRGPEPMGIFTDASEYMIGCGDEFPLIVYGYNREGKEQVLTEGVAFESSDLEIFRVTSSGILQGVKAGEAILKISYQNYSVTRKIVVQAEAYTVTGLKLDSDMYKLKVGESCNAVVSVQGTGSEKSMPGGIVFESSNIEVAEVEKTGHIKALQPGHSKLTVKCGGATASADIMVESVLQMPVLKIREEADKVELSWDKTDDAKSYNVKRGLSPSKLTTIAPGISVTSYIDYIPDPNQTYFYAVTAVDVGQESPQSNVVNSTTAPAAPTLVYAYRNNSVKLDWTDEYGSDSYIVYRKASKSGAFEAITEKLQTTRFVDENIEAGGTYYYAVKGFDKLGRSSKYSNEIIAEPEKNKAIQFAPNGDNDSDGVKNIDELLKCRNIDQNEKLVKTKKIVNISVKKRNVAKKINRVFKSKDNRVSVNVFGDDYLKAAPLSAEDSEDLFLKGIKGVIGKPVELSAGGIDINSAEITMSYDKDEIGNIPEDNLTIYWVDRDNMKLVPLTNVKVDKKSKTVSAVTTHFSTYLLGDRNLPIDLKNVDIVFAVDQSASMKNLDANNEHLKLVEKFIGEMSGTGENNTFPIDTVRIGLVEFSDFATVAQELTYNKTTLKTKLESMKHTMGGTSVADAVWVSQGMFNYETGTSDGNRRKIIVLATDGNDTCGSVNAQVLTLAEELKRRNVVINTVALGKSADVEMLKAIAEKANGSYLYVDYDKDTKTQAIDDQIQIVFDKLVKQVTLAQLADISQADLKINKSVFSGKYLGNDADALKKLYTPAKGNLLTGNYMNQVTDLVVGCAGPDLQIERTYNSYSGGEGTVMGNGWSMNYDSHIEIAQKLGKVKVSALNFRAGAGTNYAVKSVLAYGTVFKVSEEDSAAEWIKIRLSNGAEGYVYKQYTVPLDSNIVVTYGSGTKAEFVLYGSSYVASDGIDDTLAHDSTAPVYNLTRKDQTKYAYDDQSGKLKTITDRYGNVVTIEYNGDRISKVKEPTGKALTFQYNSSSKLWKVTDSLGRKVEYEYDNYGNLTGVFDLNGNKMTYEYYNKFDDETMAFEKSNLKSIIDANGHQVIKNDYDELDRLVRQYNANNDVRYQIYKDRYLNQNQTLQEGFESLERYYIDENGNESMLVFNPVLQKVVSERNAYGYTINHQYFVYYTGEKDEPIGWKEVTNLTDVSTDPIAKAEYEIYDKTSYIKHRTKEIVTNKQHKSITTYEYDERNNLEVLTDANTKTKVMEYDGNNNLIKLLDGRGKTTRYDYNGNLLTTITDPLGNKTSFEYYEIDDSIKISGLVKKVTENRKPINSSELIDFKTTTYNYDSVHNDRSEIIDAKQNPTKEVYDLAGRLIQVTDAKLHTTKYRYDNMNCLLSEEDHFGNKIVNQYDKVGNKRCVTDKNGYSTEFVYSNKNQLIRIVDAEGYTKEFKYDPNGNLIEEKNQKGGITQYEYDNINRISRTIDPLGNETTYRYDVDETGTNNVSGQNNVQVAYPTKGIRRVVITEFDPLYQKVKEREQYLDQDVIKERVTKYSYDENGNLVTVTDAKEKVTKYTYDDLNRLTNVIDNYIRTNMNDAGQYIGTKNVYGYKENCIETKTQYDVYKDAQNNCYETITVLDPRDRKTVKEFNALGQLVKVTEEKNRVTSYTYDAVGNLETETNPRKFVTSYEYDALNRLVKTLDATRVNSTQYEYDAKGNVFAITDWRKKRTEFTYNCLGQVIGTYDPLMQLTRFTYDEMGNKKTVTDGDKNIIGYEYDLKGQLAAETDAEGHTKYYRYDGLGNKIFESSRRNQQKGTEFIYNELNRLVKVKGPDGTVSAEYTYDIIGNVTSKKDANGNVTNYTYDKLYRLESTVYPGDESIPANTVNNWYDELDNLVRSQNSLGQVNTYDYDELYRLTSHKEQKADGEQVIEESTEYDVNNNKTKVIDGNLVPHIYTYDCLDRLETSKITVSGIDQVTTYGYDENGNQTSIKDWRNNTITFAYDDLNRLSEKRDADQKLIETLKYNAGNKQTKSYDAYSHLTEYFYDRNYRLTGTNDAENHTTSQTYDEDGNIITKTDGNSNTTFEYDVFNRLVSVADALNQKTQYTYDPNGNMLTQTNPKGFTTTFVYNAADKVKTRIDNGGSVGPVETYTYYADGSLQSKVDRNGITTAYTYDIHNRLTSQTCGDINIAFTYDGNGNQLTMTDRTGTTVRTYDQMNRVLTKTVPSIGAMTYTYDATSGMPTGFVAETAKDPKNNITQKVYDKSGRLKTVSVNGGSPTTYNYYDNGNRQNVIYPDGSSENYTYYNDNLIASLTNKRADGSVIDEYTYTYDNAHNQKTKVDSREGTTSYDYDKLNRLEKVTEPNGRVTAYAFDRAGNRQNESILSGSLTQKVYSYDDKNRLTNITTATNGLTSAIEAFGYDNNGNQLTSVITPYAGGIPQTPKETTNTYDALNQLITTTIDGQTMTNTYNGEGLRVGKNGNGQDTRYLYEYDKVILELDGQGNQTAMNVYGTNLLQRQTQGQTAYYMYNGHGDVTALIGTGGQELARYSYDAFGNILKKSGSISNPIRYAGYQYDEETGMYYLNARMYDPVTARFMQEDTYRGSAEDPLSLNLYTYCHNEPVMYSDPTGNIDEFTVRNIRNGNKAKTQQILKNYGLDKDDYTYWAAYGDYLNRITSQAIGQKDAKAVAKKIDYYVRKTRGTDRTTEEDLEESRIFQMADNRKITNPEHYTGDKNVDIALTRWNSIYPHLLRDYQGDPRQSLGADIEFMNTLLYKSQEKGVDVSQYSIRQLKAIYDQALNDSSVLTETSIGATAVSTARNIRITQNVVNIVREGTSEAVDITARYGGAAQRQALLNRVTETGTLSEAKGVVYSFREMKRLGYSLEDVSLHYKGNQGLDLIFSKNGRYAVTEAKHGKYLSLLKKDVKGLRQGSLDYNIDRLNKYLKYGDGTHNDLVNTLLNEAEIGQLDSFASLYKGKSLYELPIGWPDVSGIKR